MVAGARRSGHHPYRVIVGHVRENEPETTVCSYCGTATERVPVTWVCSVENGRRRYVCESCARANIRAIEGRFDSPEG